MFCKRLCHKIASAMFSGIESASHHCISRFNQAVPVKASRRTIAFVLLVTISILFTASLYNFTQTPKMGRTSARSFQTENRTFKLENNCDEVKDADIQTDLDILLGILRDPNTRQTCAWMRMRVTQMWSAWLQAIRRLERKQNMSKRRKRKVLMYLGFLSKKANLGFAEMQFKGGPLGELVVWSDLVAALYILGHDVKVATEFEELNQYRHLLTLNQSRVEGESTYEQPDTIIYTDIIGLKHISNDIHIPYDHYKCRLRVLDSFGVHAAFNHKKYSSRTNRTTIWGGFNLRLQQFYNMFPHTPDDSFLGFVVRSNLSNGHRLQKENIALVYGKSSNLWKGKGTYINQFNKSGYTVHGTVGQENNELPQFVINHKILHGGEFQRLLRRAKLFLGLGDPLEGPAALEAIAHGAVFINPKIKPPIDYRKFGKPTERKVRSQSPYIEDFIGEPYAYTVDIANTTEVNDVIQKINRTNVFTAFRPYEFTEEGYIQRVNSFIEHQEFCNYKHQNWPTDGDVTLMISDPGVSCMDTCWNNNLICEPSHFYRSNSTDIYKTHGFECSKTLIKSDIYFPAVNVQTNECILQGDELLFSCVGQKDIFRRLCPCRTYVKYQSALCIGCS